MKLAVVSESSADEASIRVLVNGLLGRETEPASLTPRSRGWPSVLRILPAVLKELHFHCEVDALAVVADSNNSPIHDDKIAEGVECGCRLCQLRATIREVQATLRPVPGKPHIVTAVGLAVPSLEAWLCCGRNPNVSEASWVNGQKSGQIPYTVNQLKKQAYGAERVPLEVQTRLGIEECRRLVKDVRPLEALFSIGFGALARDVRGWLPRQA